MEAGQKSLFYAFPSKPAHVAETIHAMADEINSLDDGLDVVTWTSLRNSGRVLFMPIAEQIRKCDAFCCDLTYLNDNVLFELGFAMALNKPVFISLNSSISGSKKGYSRFRLLENIGYATYANHHDLHRKLFDETPWSAKPAENVSSSQRGNLIFYARLPTPTDASNAVDSTIAGFSQADVQIRIDDLQEAPYQSLDWYREQIGGSLAVVIHRLGDEQSGPEDHNHRCSLLAGMAVGFGLSETTLVLAQDPAPVPLDFKEVFKSYGTSKDARDLSSTWADRVRLQLTETSSKRKRRRGRLRSAQTLRGISFGQMVAENERSEIGEYLIETGPFQSALDGRAVLFVGRKGTGKSANVIAVEERLREERGVLVCPIKPVGYMLDSLVEVLGGITNYSEEGFLIGSVWKYLVFTELALAVRYDVSDRSAQLFPTEHEEALIHFIEQNPEFFNEDFGQRLNYGIAAIKPSDVTSSSDAKVLKVSEALHSQLLARLRDLLKAATADRKRVAVLVDNLDKNWKHDSDVNVLIGFLRGLVDVAERIQDELQTRPFGVKGPKYSISIFLRSDIYATFRERSGERDKVNGEILDWHDQEQLGRLLDERLEYFARVDDAASTWSEYFEDIDGVGAREFILENVLARPRDAIFITNSALDKAKNRGHTEVTKEDLIEAFKAYSNWAFDSLLAEDHPSHGMLESVLFEFIGSTCAVTLGEVTNIFTDAGVSQDLHEYYMELLLDTNFLGLMAPDDDVVYPSNEDSRRRQRRIQEKLYQAECREPRYFVHPAFYPALGISEP